jgi:hypothetical protein
MGVDYGWLSFHKAVQYAVASGEPTQQRLNGCLLEIHHLRKDNFPNDKIFERFETLIAEATRLPERFKGEGTLAATTSQMTDADAKQWLVEIFDLFSELAQARGASSKRSLSRS